MTHDWCILIRTGGEREDALASHMQVIHSPPGNAYTRGMSPPPPSRRLSGVFHHPFHWRPGTNTGDDIEDRPMPVNERNMRAMSAALRSQPLWWTKHTDPDIRARWKAEVMHTPVLYGDAPLREEEIEYVLDELAHYAAVRDARTGIEASVASRIWQSDILIEEALRNELLGCVARLEDVPDSMKDWRPDSNGQMLNLVDPALYPIVYDRTLASSDPYPPLRDALELPDTFSGINKNLLQAMPFPQYQDMPGDTPVNYRPLIVITKEELVSERFQWLPTDFVVSADGASARALGYINNLEPRTHRDAYPVIEKLVARFVPLWERVLGETAVAYVPPARVKNFCDVDLVESQPGEVSNAQGGGFRKVVTLPALLSSFKGHPAPPVVDLKGKTLQVFVKLMNIHLTPDKPEFPGTSWNLAGMVSEAIVCSGIYYYDEENVTESRHAFLAGVNGPLIQEDDDDLDGVYEAFQLELGDELVQELGAVATKGGRCIAFPNIYQHQMQPFTLVDACKQGHRKILALFLVDPCLRQRRPSTTIVPAQQCEWVATVLHELAASPQSRLASLPAELIEIISKGVDDTMTREEAKALRLELADERRSMNERNNVTFAVQWNPGVH